ncbi:MAG: Crp/Fnr family transcriptional regulator [Flavobacteriales bacterium]|nr:Crp/Fnr family transcriptional regulator [Flavobacteriales bacterium]
MSFAFGDTYLPNMDDLRKWLKDYSELSPKEWTALSKALERVQIGKNERFQTAGRIAGRIGFLQSGAMYARYADEQRKHRVAYFNMTTVNRIVCDLQAFTAGGRATMDIKAVEPCDLFVLDREQLYSLYDQHQGIERLGRKLAEYSYARAMDRIGRMEKSNEERVADLRKFYPEVIRTFTRSQVGEYLNTDKHEVSRALTQLNGHAKSDAKTRSRPARPPGPL